MTIDERSDAQIHLDDLQNALIEANNLLRQLASYIASYGYVLAEKVNTNLRIALGASEALKEDIKEIEQELDSVNETIRQEYNA